MPVSQWDCVGGGGLLQPDESQKTRRRGCPKTPPEIDSPLAFVNLLVEI